MSWSFPRQSQLEAAAEGGESSLYDRSWQRMNILVVVPGPEWEEVRPPIYTAHGATQLYWFIRVLLVLNQFCMTGSGTWHVFWWHRFMGAPTP